MRQGSEAPLLALGLVALDDPRLHLDRAGDRAQPRLIAAQEIAIVAGQFRPSTSSHSKNSGSPSRPYFKAKELYEKEKNGEYHKDELEDIDTITRVFVVIKVM